MLPANLYFFVGIQSKPGFRCVAAIVTHGVNTLNFGVLLWQWFLVGSALSKSFSLSLTNGERQLKNFLI